MAEELEVATNRLNSALDHYSKACSNLRDHYSTAIRLNNASPESTSRVLQELSLIASYETELQHSKALVSRLANFTESARPQSISSLPAEILVRIFTLVCYMHPCPQSLGRLIYSRQPPLFNKDPITLSHVCSHWRQIAINTPGLWTHLDLTPKQFQVATRLERTNAYMTRSGQSLLDVHIVDKSTGPEYDRITYADLPPDSNFLDFLASTAPRIRSLEIFTGHPPTQGNFCHYALSICFERCLPDRLRQLDINVARDFDPWLSPGNAVDPAMMGLPKATVESLWRSVTVFRSSQFYPRWSSKLYEGLVELCLTGEGPDASIPESNLIAILRSSPGLRVLKIDLEITHARPRNSQVEPVPLHHLEHLRPGWIQETQLGILLRWIVPGPGPLSFAMINPWIGGTLRNEVQFTSRVETAKFFARSNVFRLYAAEFDGYDQLADALSMVPSVRALVVDALTCHQIGEESALPPEFTLDELYVVRSSQLAEFTWSSIERMVRKHRIRKLALWHYDFRYAGLGERGMEVIPENLHTICPVVNVYPDDEPSPVEDWY